MSGSEALELLAVLVMMASPLIAYAGLTWLDNLGAAERKAIEDRLRVEEGLERLALLAGEAQARRREAEIARLEPEKRWRRARTEARRARRRG